MLDIKTEGARPLAFLLSEANGARSRANIVVAAGAGVLAPGTVIGVVTASGKYAASGAAAVAGFEGAETAAAVLAYPVDATGDDVQAVAIVRDAEMKLPMLVFAAGVDTQPEKDAKLAALAASRLIAR